MREREGSPDLLNRLADGLGRGRRDVLLERCDGLIRLPGVSTGADGETDWCDENGVPWMALAHSWGSPTSRTAITEWIAERWPTEAP